MVGLNEKLLDQVNQYLSTNQGIEITFRRNGLALVKKNFTGSQDLSFLLKQHSYQQLVINIEGGQIVNIQQIIRTKI